MRILTVRQPWAWAIIHRGKDVENRSRNIAGSYRGPVAIHSGLARFEQHNLASQAHRAAGRDRNSGVDTSLWYGAILGVVDLVDVHSCGQWPPAQCDDYPTGKLTPLCSSWGEMDCWHLVFANPRPLVKPIAYTGALGLRELPTDVELQILGGIK